ncbi:hypothetical protein PQ610_07095 [Tardisphaera miroshnichenkoae]
MAVVLAMASAGLFSRTLQETHREAAESSTSAHLFIEVISIEVSAILLFAFIFTPSSLSNPSTAALYGLKVASAIIVIMAFGRLFSQPLIAKLESYLKTREATFSVVMGMVLPFGFFGAVRWLQLGDSRFLAGHLRV